MTQKLSSKQLKTLEALLQGMTVPEAATLADVSTRQVYRWLEGGEFSNRLADEQDTVLHLAGVRLVGLTSDALSALADVMDRPEQRGANVKRLAARDVLEMCLRFVEAGDFATRLGALEERLQ